MSTSEHHKSWLHRIVGVIGAAFLHVVGKTSFVHTFDDPAYSRFRRDRLPVVYAFWHNAQVFLAYAHRGEKINIIVSRSKDGEFIAQVMKHMKLNAVRGSSSKGAEQALLEMVSLIQTGRQVGFTPDGPRGPVQTIQGGVVLTSEKTGAPVVATAVASSRKLVFNSWDKFFVPLPFGRVVVSHGKPLYLSPDIDLDQAKARVRDALNAQVEEAQKKLADAPGWFNSLIGSVLFWIYSLLAPVLGVIAFPFVLMFMGPGRATAHLKERFTAEPGPLKGKRVIWFHSASIGEWRALRPLIDEFKKSGLSLLITVTTPEARGLIEREEPEAVVRMAPVDVMGVVGPWVKKMNPEYFLIVETELWPRLINACYSNNVPVFIVNGRLSNKSMSTWRFFTPLIHRVTNQISGFFVRTGSDKSHYMKIGAAERQIRVTGNTKYDNLAVKEGIDRSAIRKKLFGQDDGVYIIGGSTWPGEEKLLLSLFNSTPSANLKLILAPRRKSRFDEVKSLLSAQTKTWSLWSEIKAGKKWDTDIVLVDTLGDLPKLYETADIAFVGGSYYKRGGQNPMEPAAAGVPAVFGPSMHNFREEAADLIESGGALQGKTEGEIRGHLIALINGPDQRKMRGQAAARAILERQGGSSRTWAEFEEMLSVSK